MLMVDFVNGPVEEWQVQHVVWCVEQQILDHIAKKYLENQS